MARDRTELTISSAPRIYGNALKVKNPINPSIVCIEK